MSGSSKTVIFLTGALVLCGTGVAFANLEQAKVYKSAFGGDKPKCINCHVDKLPKKTKASTA